MEVLITLVILSVSLLALAALMATTTKNNSFGSHVTEAATFAQDKLEEIRATQWGNIGNNQDQVPGSTGINYIRNWTVQTNGALKTVTITVNWNDRTNHMIRLLSVAAQ